MNRFESNRHLHCNICALLPSIALLFCFANACVHACVSYLFEFSQNVRLAEHEDLVVVQLDQSSTVLRQENLVPGFQSIGVQVSRHVHLSRTDGDNLTLVGVLGSIGGQDDAAGGRGFLGCSLDQDAVSEGLQ